MSLRQRTFPGLPFIEFRAQQWDPAFRIQTQPHRLTAHHSWMITRAQPRDGATRFSARGAVSRNLGLLVKIQRTRPWLWSSAGTQSFGFQTSEQADVQVRAGSTGCDSCKAEMRMLSCWVAENSYGFLRPHGWCPSRKKTHQALASA